MTDAARLARPPTSPHLAGVGVWTSRLDMIPAAQAQTYARELEELGYSAVWLPEVAGRDPFVHAALLLASTDRLVAATGIATMWGRDAVAMNSAHRSLTEAFPDRFLLGLGVSHQNLVEGLRGHVYEKPLTAMRDYLDAMDKAPFTAQRPTAAPRRVLAALRPRMLALAAERADGAHTYFVTPEHTQHARTVLGGSALLCVEQAVLVETDPSRARDVARRHTATYLSQPNYARNLLLFGYTEEDLVDGGSDRLVDALVVWGDPSTIRDRVQAHRDAGADHVCIQALSEGPRDVQIDQWRELAAPLVDLVGPRSRSAH